MIVRRRAKRDRSLFTHEEITMDHTQKNESRRNDTADQAPDECPRLASDLYMQELAIYAEARVAHGREEAERHVPLLVEHLRGCLPCTSAVDEMVAFLNEPDETR